jgi:hypothetical protein
VSVPEKLKQLAGTWTGESSLWLAPGEPVRKSVLRGSLALLGNGQFLAFTYTWSDEGAAQDGLLLLAFGAGEATAQASWVDSWHTGEAIMSFSGACDEDATVKVRGSYPAPAGPDWGWRIEVHPGAASWTLRMFNITPDGHEMLAVEAALSRAA